MVPHFITRSVAVCFGSAVFSLLAGVTLQASDNARVTEAVGYVSMDLSGGSVSARGLSFVSPAFVNPVQWQGQVVSVSGQSVTVANAEWDLGAFDSRYAFEVASGPHAGLWTEIVSTSGNVLTVADSLAGVLQGGESVRIRRFTTLSDFLGANNEAGLTGSGMVSSADIVSVFHSTGIKSYWYYDGTRGGEAGWHDTSWKPAADAIITPGEGAVIERVSTEPLKLWQTGIVKSGVQKVLVNIERSFIGSIIPADISLADSQLYTGSEISGIGSGRSPMNADSVVVYGNSIHSYWHYDGSQGGTAGWYDTGWKPAGDALLKAGSTMIIERRKGDAFVWRLPAFIP